MTLKKTQKEDILLAMLVTTELTKEICVHLTIIPRARVGYEMIDESQRVA